MLKNLLRTMLGAWLWAILFPGMCIFLLPCLIVKIINNLAALIFTKDLQPLPLLDAIVTTTPSNEHPLMNCCQVWKLEGHLSLEKFRTHFYQCFLSSKILRKQYENFRCNFVRWGLYCYKKKLPLDPVGLLSSQITNYSGSPFKNEADLEQFIGKWMSDSVYDDKGVLWRILIIHGGNSETANTTLLFKIDHGLCDGYTFLHLVGKLSEKEVPYNVRDDGVTVWKKLQYFLQTPVTLGSALFKMLATPIIPYPGNKASGRLKPSAAKQKWMVSFTTLDLRKVKEIRKMLNIHYTTVMGALLMGAVRRWLINEEGKTVENLPEVGYCPSPTGWPGHPAFKGVGMGNHLSFVNPAFPFRSSDPVTRLFKGEQSYLDGEDVGWSWIMRAVIVPIIYVIPQKLYSILIEGGMTLGVQQVSTPLMCSSEKHSILGHEAKHLYLPVHTAQFLRPLHMFMVPTSFAGQLDVSVNATQLIFQSYEKLQKFTQIYLKLEMDHMYEKVMTLDNK